MQKPRNCFRGYCSQVYSPMLLRLCKQLCGKCSYIKLLLNLNRCWMMLFVIKEREFH